MFIAQPVLETPPFRAESITIASNGGVYTAVKTSDLKVTFGG